MASHFQNKLKKKYEDLGFLCILLKKTNKIGDPDILCVKPGDNILFVEKSARSLSKMKYQAYRIDLLRDQGFDVIVDGSLKLAEKYEGLGWTTISIFRSSRGIDPKLICVAPGDNIFFVESKERTDRVSDVQHYRHQELRHMGFKVYIEQDLKPTHKTKDKYIGDEIHQRVKKTKKQPLPKPKRSQKRGEIEEYQEFYR